MEDVQDVPVFDLRPEEALEFLLRSEAYCNITVPDYVNFSNLLQGVRVALSGPTGDANPANSIDSKNIRNQQRANYHLYSNKDGHFSWRRYELIHPVLYVQLVHLMTDPDNWAFTCRRMKTLLRSSLVEVKGLPKHPGGKAMSAHQINIWWDSVELDAIEKSLRFSHVLQTDISDCYGSLYTHAIAWALHGKPDAKAARSDRNLLGNKIDRILQDLNDGQTNGIPQGSVLMDMIAEIVLCAADKQISDRIRDRFNGIDFRSDFSIVRYRDDYRIYANSDFLCTELVRIVSEELREFGFRLSIEKTSLSRDVLAAALKKDKWASLHLHDDDRSFYKRLLLVASFSRQHPNSGAVIRMLTDIVTSSDLALHSIRASVYVAILADLLAVNPRSAPQVSAILSKVLVKQGPKKAEKLLLDFKARVDRIGDSEYLNIWIQRVCLPYGVEGYSGTKLLSNIRCEKIALWRDDFISCKRVKKALKIPISDCASVKQLPKEISVNEVNVFLRLQALAGGY